jgi:hypothetical protein
MAAIAVSPEITFISAKITFLILRNINRLAFESAKELRKLRTSEDDGRGSGASALLRFAGIEPGDQANRSFR